MHGRKDLNTDPSLAVDFIYFILVLEEFQILLHVISVRITVRIQKKML